MEIGGIRGKVLTQAVQKIHETFREIYAIFGNRWKSTNLDDSNKYLSGSMTVWIQTTKAF